ncbi:uncharacterized protein VTP21DRAFT_8993 [Calcarisporiella thermophila]|uniref:uncharacterized protein n=1 Tax=Calcarisporiella thermophila TaxID=911321 RepID=UPI00374295AA
MSATTAQLNSSGNGRTPPAKPARSRGQSFKALRPPDLSPDLPPHRTVSNPTSPSDSVRYTELNIPSQRATHHTLPMDSAEDELECSPFGRGNGSIDRRTSLRTSISKLSAIARERIAPNIAQVSTVVQEKSSEWRAKGGEAARGYKNTAVEKWKKWQEQRGQPGIATEIVTESWDEDIHVFGASLQAALDMTYIEGKALVPGVVVRCVEFLDKHGLDEVGLYRVSGSASSVARLKTVFDNGSDLELAVGEQDSHTVSTLLKTYLRELPEPIIPSQFISKFNDTATLFYNSATHDEVAGSSSSNTLDDLANLVSSLPPANFHILAYVCNHLRRVASHSEHNKMTTSNLSLIFCPTLGIGNKLFKLFVNEGETLFQHPPVPTTIVRTVPSMVRRDSACESTSEAIPLMGPESQPVRGRRSSVSRLQTTSIYSLPSSQSSNSTADGSLSNGVDIESDNKEQRASFSQAGLLSDHEKSPYRVHHVHHRKSSSTPSALIHPPRAESNSKLLGAAEAWWEGNEEDEKLTALAVPEKPRRCPTRKRIVTSGSN